MKRDPLPCVVGAAAALFYLAWPSSFYNMDGVACAIAVELGDLRHLVHGNHVLYGLVGLAFHRLWQLLGYQGPAILPLQTLNSLIGKKKSAPPAAKPPEVAAVPQPPTPAAPPEPMAAAPPAAPAPAKTEPAKTETVALPPGKTAAEPARNADLYRHTQYFACKVCCPLYQCTTAGQYNACRQMFLITGTFDL